MPQVTRQSNPSLEPMVTDSDVGKKPIHQLLLWLGLSIFTSLLYFGAAFRETLDHPYIIQDDARQHVFWMQRFIDPASFPNDAIADYFQSVAPKGYTALYQWLSPTISPYQLSLILPGILSVATAVASYRLVWQLLRQPAIAGLATILLLQAIWMDDDLVSATPRAFAYLLLLLFFNGYVARSLLWCGAVISIQSFIYPHCVLICAGVLVLGGIRAAQQQRPFAKGWPQQRTWRWWFDRYGLYLIGLLITATVLLPYFLQTSGYGPTLTLTEAKTMPELMPGGRSEFFNSNPLAFWFWGQRSGVFAEGDTIPWIAVVGFAYPFLNQWRWAKVHRPPGCDRLQELLACLLQSSLALFFLAHAVAFKLHLPVRYTKYSFRISVVLAAAVVIWVAIQALLVRYSALLRTYGRLSAILLLGLFVFQPFAKDTFPHSAFKTGDYPDLYQFVSSLPNNTMLATISKEADNIPSFTHRSVLIAREYAIPYQLGYYHPFRQRVEETIETQYSANSQEVLDFQTRYSVTHWLLENQSFTPDYLTDYDWIQHYQSASNRALANLEQNLQPFLEQAIAHCTVFRNQRFTVVETQCLQAWDTHARPQDNRPSDNNSEA
ncbi:MAG: hypothetical protein AB4040_16670 [Synechococcus sp.]